MSAPAYMAEPWFNLLQRACQAEPRARVAARMGISAPVVGQVLNGSGLYGNGQASTRKVAIKVEHTFGHWPCPHLTEQGDGAEQVITAARCREFAHRDAPTSSPRDIAHWQACRKCPHQALTAPPKPRPVVPRKRAAEPIPPTATTAQEDPTP